MTTNKLVSESEFKIIKTLISVILLLFVFNVIFSGVQSYNKNVQLKQEYKRISAETIPCKDCGVNFGAYESCGTGSPLSTLPNFLLYFLLSFSYLCNCGFSKRRFIGSAIFNLFGLGSFLLWMFSTYKSYKSYERIDFASIGFSDYLLKGSNFIDYIICGLLLLVFIAQFAVFARLIVNRFQAKPFLV
jgi:hypothetical protein